MNQIRHYFLRKALIDRSQAHLAGYEWALAQLKLGVTTGSVVSMVLMSTNDPFDCGVADACFDFSRANHEPHHLQQAHCVYCRFYEDGERHASMAPHA